MRYSLLLAIVLGGCSNPTPGHGPSDGTPSPLCAQLDQQISDALAAPGSCDTDADCGVIGGAIGTPSCACVPYVVECGGRAMANNAPGLGQARALVQQFVTAGCSTGVACDCGPRGPLRCNAQHQCVADPRSCNPAPPDAGPGGGGNGW